ncbi:PREDICTED: sialic acid-binding Ig-like lectin 5 [Miniopterus natalensis]|uniref:sialic acid-binding Ig-like lectin 5 n=1 Tax=Miniopterus natalensis TaxID=291302 RepID=UPI0007A706A2|nr:PREDICTED: sialic acid-binding Ig-like lectin 5 [Miniopterus natalensis]
MSLRLLLLLLLWGGPLAKSSDYKLHIQESVTVQESLCVTVPCTFSYSRMTFGYLYLSWFRKGVDTKDGLPVATNKPAQKLQGRTQGRFLLPMGLNHNDCSLIIRDVNRRDSGTYFLHIQKGFSTHSYSDKMLSLKVTALTHTPSILSQGTLQSGHPKKLTCFVPWACEEGTLPIFSWVSAAHTSLGTRTNLSSELTLIPRPQDHGTNITCQVYFPPTGATVKKTTKLNVTYAPQNMAISVFQGNSTAFEILQTTSLSVLEGETLRLRCVADSNPPAQLSWFRGSPALNATPISSTEILELPRVGTAEEGEFTCQAQHWLGSQSVSLRLSVVYPPQLLGPSCSWEDQGLTCSCSSRAQPAPSLRWLLGDGLLKGNHSEASYSEVTSHSVGPWTNSSLSFSRGLSAGLRLSCEARNVHGAQSASALLLPGQGDSQGQRLRERGMEKALSSSQPSGPRVLELPRIQMDHEGKFISRAQSLQGSLSVSLSLSVQLRMGA